MLANTGTQTAEIKGGPQWVQKYDLATDPDQTAF